MSDAHAVLVMHAPADVVDAGTLVLDTAGGIFEYATVLAVVRDRGLGVPALFESGQR